MIRSYLFVPADSEHKMHKAAASAADAIILDLEDSVALSSKPAARECARNFLAADNGACNAEIWVRINPLHTDDAMEDLRSVMPAAPAGIVVPKPLSADAIVELAKTLEVYEDQNGIPLGATRILPICTEQPEALFRLHSYVSSTDRLAGLTWGAEDLSAAVGASTARDLDGSWLPPYELARSLCLFAAAAAGVAAVDTVFTNIRDANELTLYAARARRDGFTGMLAIHPAQIDVINAAFVPTGEEVDRASRIVELFQEDSNAGVFNLDGEMIDRPHLIQAQRILLLAERLQLSKSKG